MPLSDLIMCTDDDARSARLPPVGDSDRLDVKGVDVIAFAELSCIFKNQAFNVDELNQFELVHKESEEGPWTYRVPDALVRQLAQLSSPQLERVGEAWTKQLWGGDITIVLAALRQLSRFASRALTEGKGVFLWNSL